MRRPSRLCLTLVVAILLGSTTVSCDDPTPPSLDLSPTDSGIAPPDGGDDGEAFAPWPPEAGTAGLSLVWTVDGKPTDESRCAAADLDAVRLSLVDPQDDGESWTDGRLEADCPAGEIRIAPAHGLAAGRYRFEVELFKPAGGEFQHKPSGEVSLTAGQTVRIAVIDVTVAEPGGGALVSGGDSCAK